jgi:hypothetical protein
MACGIDKAQQDFGSNHRDTVGSAVGGDYRRVSGQSGLPAAAAAAQRQVLNSYLLDSTVIAEDPGVVELEARWMPLLWEGLRELEEVVSIKRAAATTYEQMGVFNRAHKDVLGICAALRYMGRRFLRCLPKRIRAEGDSYVLLREGHPGVLAVLEDPDWAEYERKM